MLVRKSVLLCSIVFLLILAGCASVQSDRIALFGTGVTAAKQQTEVAFAAVNDLTADAMIDFAAKQPTLNEKNLVPVLPSESIAQWHEAFSLMETYAAQLASLTSPNITEDFKGSMVALGQQIHEKKPEAFPVGIGTAFIKLADVLIRLKAQKDAHEIIMATDPAVRDLCAAMAEAIGGDNTHGIRGTVQANWATAMSVYQTQFLNTQDSDGRRDLVVKFASFIKARDSQNLVLGSLRNSYLALADAHHALLQRDPWSFDTTISVIRQELEDTKELQKKLNQ